MFPIPGIDISPLRIVIWILIIVWAVGTLSLLDYYLTSNGWINGGTLTPWSNGPNATQLSVSEAGQLDLGLKPQTGLAARQHAIGELVNLRTLYKDGDYTGLASLYVRVKGEVKDSASEPYRMQWVPILSCAMSGCPDREVISAAGRFAAEDARYGPNAVIIETVYYYQASANGDKDAVALASARLDRLVRDFGSPDLMQRWKSLQACKDGCADLESQTVDFIAVADKN
ncbi:MAG: hypothetical protein V1728_02620 [Candidatus Micrarchaeota archaeon]